MNVREFIGQKEELFADSYSTRMYTDSTLERTIFQFDNNQTMAKEFFQKCVDADGAASPHLHESNIPYVVLTKTGIGLLLDQIKKSDYSDSTKKLSSELFKNDCLGKSSYFLDLLWSPKTYSKWKIFYIHPIKYFGNFHNPYYHKPDDWTSLTIGKNFKNEKDLIVVSFDLLSKERKISRLLKKYGFIQIDPIYDDDSEKDTTHAYYELM